VNVVKCCAFTGHRPQSLPFGFREAAPECTALKQCLREQIITLAELGVTHYISGMAIGVDMYAAEIVLELKAVYPKLTLECAFPCETQAVKWSEPLRERYYNIAAQCDQETLLQTHYTAGCMQRRNRYMVDQSDLLLAVWNGRPSGTGKTVLYAQSKGHSIWCIDPQTLQVTHM
jgi:uncharacterized phage-like protein YoqJ